MVLVGALVVVAVVALLVLAYRARQALLLAFTGFFLAVGIEPAVRALVRHGVRRGAGVALVALGVVVVGAVLVAVLIVPGLRQLAALVQEAPQLLDRVAARFGGPSTSAGAALADPTAHARVAEVGQQLGQVLVSALTAVFSALGLLLGGAAAALTTLVLMVYFALAMPRLHAGMARLLARPHRVDTLDEALARVGGYVAGQVLVSLIAGATAFVFFLIVGVPYPALLALVVALLDALPQVGAFLASLIGTAVALSQSWGLALATLAFFCVYQAVENYVIAPRVFSRTIDLSPLAAFVAVLAGASLGGLLGALVALPVTAAGKIVISRLLAARRERTA
ncbi:AI-2E family transporter [Actinomycetospora cinnamomea]|uniref:Putative PurR-regulated permease PerM n=1 Tax=Actinomycetospora cinnamomea TaxID=663609 RepID=A0A2U1EDP2_9PSEU|nr:AI-2E family transporter [Actinomycetospora cinnamomea]PVY97997.1 putative PurR-regulated permease PerM [Actinomycetospora cinnamomea]